MKLAPSLSMLLASLTLLLAIPEAVQAAPVRSGVVTLPLKRVHSIRSDLSAGVQFQQHVNRGLKRYARMTGREAPSDEELSENIHRRAFAEDAVLDRRYYRPEVGNSNAASPPLNVDAKVAGKGKGQGAAAAAAAGSGAAAGSATPGSKVKGLTIAEAPTTANSLGLNIEAKDVGYIATVQIGTPPRDFSLLMDSGSSDLWVGSEVSCVDVTTGGGCGTHTFLGPKSSSSFVDTKAPFQVTYGTGAVAGTIVTDDVSFGGLTLKAHSFGVANKETDDFGNNQTPFDGLMGLALSTLSNQKVPTPPQSLLDGGLVKEGTVAFKISRAADNKNDGEVTFGGVDSSKFDPKTFVTLANVSPTGFWEAGGMTVNVGGTDIALKGGARSAILDTGTTLVIAPPADAAAVHAAIPGSQSDGQGGFTIPCNTKTQVALAFGGQTFAIDSRDLAFAPADNNGNCISGISSGQVGGATEWLVGDVFLKNAYFVTSFAKDGSSQIGLAKLV